MANSNLVDESEASQPPEWDMGYNQVPIISLSEDARIVSISNFRNFRYDCMGAHESKWETREFNLDEVCSLDFVVVPFGSHRYLAHTMVSFGFSSGEHLSISVEARRPRGRPFSIFRGLFGAFSLIYVIADERDTIGVRAECRQNVVHLYPSAASPDEARLFLQSMLHRAKKLSDKPEKYHTLFNNCVTNLRGHANEIWPGLVRWGWQIIATGHVGHFAYQLGLLKKAESFELLDKKARIHDLAKGNWHRDDFSQLIRSRWGK